MKILAIETSCDETAAAVIENGWRVLSNVIASSIEKHQITGGVVPEVAARAQVQYIIPVIDQALRKTFPRRTRKQQIALIDAIAVTTKPGLVTSLIVGTETAKWLAYLWNKPLIPVNHIRGHVYANWLEHNPAKDPVEFPVVSLSVSGGHNELFLISSHDDWTLLGETHDDAAGEAFDKVARILGLGYPGGPIIERIAKQYILIPTKRVLRKAKDERVEESLAFPRAWMNSNRHLKSWDGTSFDFSFSGLKSEVWREVERRRNLAPSDKMLIAHAFQEAIFDVLVTKLIGAAKKYSAKEIHIAGGVSANKRFRALLRQRMRKEKLSAIFRTPKKMIYCTDNAAMIGAAAYYCCSNIALI